MLEDKINNLNSMQKKAVLKTEGPLLLLAGAGSGKTRVLTHRIAYLIEHGIKPFNIIAITFTNKAAREMKERVQSLTEYGSDVLISTFHSACVRILRREISRIGYSSGFTIYDADDSQKLIKQVLKELNISDKEFSPKAVMAIISKQKDILKSPDKFMAEINGSNYFYEKVAQIYKHYQASLKKNNALDFDDIIFNTVKLFKSCPDVLEKYQNRFRYIMVDEYQDTSMGQYTFIKLLSDKYKNICVVGDDDQSIYGWRGADIRNILEFEKDFENAAVIKLEQNYRSTQNILNAANGVIEKNLSRKSKKLWTENKEGDSIFFYRANRDHDEASFVVKEIKRRVSLGASYSDFAILYRNNSLSRIVEEQFVRMNIPYRVFGGVNFYSRKEIKDILAYLRLLENTDDDVSFMRIINVPKRGIGPVTIEKIASYAMDNKMSMYDALAHIGEADGIKLSSKLSDFYGFMEKIRSTKNEKTVPCILQDVIEFSGYKTALIAEGTDEAKDRIDNINEFCTKAEEYEQVHEGAGLDEFLEEVSLVADIDNYDEGTETAVLMTLHSSKGLEFPVVFIVGFEEGIFPGIRASETTEGLEEERRLCYVGITRAKKVLYITCAKTRMKFGDIVYNNPSRFKKEIPKELIKEVEDESFVKKAASNKRTLVSKPEYNPYKSLEMPKPKNIDYKFTVGEKVRHLRYGVGKVIDVRSAGADYEVTVEFSVGIKKVMAQLSGLKPVK